MRVKVVSWKGGEVEKISVRNEKMGKNKTNNEKKSANSLALSFLKWPKKNFW